MKDTGIKIHFDAIKFELVPAESVTFAFFDEYGQPLPIDYSMKSLEALEDDRIAALSVSIDVMKQLMNRVVDNRNKRVQLIADEIAGITGSPTQVDLIPKVINATCECHPTKKEEQE